MYKLGEKLTSGYNSTVEILMVAPGLNIEEKQVYFIKETHDDGVMDFLSADDDEIRFKINWNEEMFR